MLNIFKKFAVRLYLRKSKRGIPNNPSISDLEDLTTVPDLMGIDEHLAFIASTTPYLVRSRIYSDADFIDAFDEVVAKQLTDMAQDASQYSNQTNSSIWVSSTDDRIQEELTNLIERLDLETKITSQVRNMLKHGDKFSKIIIDPEEGVISLKDNYHPSEICRLEHQGELIGFHYGKEATAMERYEMVHWALSTDYVYDDILNEKRKDILQKYKVDKNPSYGFSEFYRVIALSKRLKYTEDALTLGRLARAKIYRVHNVEVAESSITQVVDIMRKYIKNWNKKKTVNYTDENAFSEKEPFSFEEDRFTPVSNGKGAGVIEQTGGDIDITGIADVEYFSKKRNHALGVPDSEAMTNRLQDDSKYARRIASVQRSYLKGLYQIFDVHLDTKGLWKKDKQYTVHLVSADSYTQTENNDMMLSIVNFIDSVMGLAQIEGVVVNKNYLLQYLIETYLKLPGVDLEMLYTEEVPTDSGETTEGIINKVISELSDQETKSPLESVRNVKTYTKSNTNNKLNDDE